MRCLKRPLQFLSTQYPSTVPHNLPTPSILRQGSCHHCQRQLLRLRENKPLQSKRINSRRRKQLRPPAMDIHLHNPRSHRPRPKTNPLLISLKQIREPYSFRGSVRRCLSLSSRHPHLKLLPQPQHRHPHTSPLHNRSKVRGQPPTLRPMHMPNHPQVPAKWHQATRL